MRLNGTFTVTIAALDEDGDGVFDFLGQRVQYNALDLYLGTANTQIILPYARATTPITIVASNVDSVMQRPADGRSADQHGRAEHPALLRLRSARGRQLDRPAHRR